MIFPENTLKEQFIYHGQMCSFAFSSMGMEKYSHEIMPNRDLACLTNYE